MGFNPFKPWTHNVRIRLVLISEQSEAAKHFSLTLYERVSLALWKLLVLISATRQLREPENLTKITDERSNKLEIL
jgi:hypothetical protein